MKPHTKIYLDYFGYYEGDFIPSEVSGKPAVDIHHIIPKGRGGKDEIGNLIALTRDEHDRADYQYTPYLSQDYLQMKHNKFLNNFA